MRKSALLLAIAYGLASLIFAAIACFMFFAMTKTFVWEFVWISAISMLLCHITRVQCIREIRTRRLFGKYYRDATEPAASQRPRVSLPIIGQTNH